MRWVRRWALVTRDTHGRATVVGTFWTREGALRSLRRDHLQNRLTWNEHPIPDRRPEPTDWAPRGAQRMRVVQLLADGPVTVAALAARTAMSPRVVERVLLELGQTKRAFCSLEETINDTGMPGPPVQVWRLRRRASF